MRTFLQMAEQLHACYPMRGKVFTTYHLKRHPYERFSLDWGVCLAHHFDTGVPIQSWLQLFDQIGNWIQAQPGLQRCLQLVPFYEVGEDFFVQPKPLFDGGYSTASYEAFLYHREQEPAPWFFRQLAELHERVVEGLRALGSQPREEFLARVIHATLIKPHDQLFWLDESGWAVYQPNVDIQAMREWEELSP
jgi:hypothetical protein